MPGVPREQAEHSLHVRPDAKPVKQPLRRFAEEKRKAIGEEIARLLVAGFIMEVFYPDWLANLVLVLKKNNTWRMCIDYTSFNKACPKDPFALPRIDQVIDSTAGCDLCLSWTPIQDITRSRSTSRIRSRHPSSPHMEPTTTSPCHSA
jgi:hypothetical protein